MPQQQDENTNHTSPFQANTGQSEQPQHPDFSLASGRSGYACFWPRRQPGEWRPVPSVSLGPWNSTAGPDASNLAEPRRYFDDDAAPGNAYPFLRYESVPSPVEGSALGGALFGAPGYSPLASPGGALFGAPGCSPPVSCGGALFGAPGCSPLASPGGALFGAPGCSPPVSRGGALFGAPGCSPPASPAPFFEEGLQDWHTMTTPEILSYGPGLFCAPEVPYGPLPSPLLSPTGWYTTDYPYGDCSVQFYSRLESPVQIINREGLYGPWPQELYYNLNLFNGPENLDGQIFGRAPTPPLRPRGPEPGVPIFRQHELGNGMSHSYSRLLSTTYEHYGEELQPYEDPEEDPEDLDDLCTCDLHRQMRGEY